MSSFGGKECISFIISPSVGQVNFDPWSLRGTASKVRRRRCSLREGGEEGPLMHTSSCQLWRSNCLKFHLQHFSLLPTTFSFFIRCFWGENFPLFAPCLSILGSLRSRNWWERRSAGGRKVGCWKNRLEIRLRNSKKRFLRHHSTIRPQSIWSILLLEPTLRKRFIWNVSR